MSCSRNAPKNFDEGYHSLSKWPTKMKSCTALVVTNRPQNHSVVFFRNRWLSSFGWCAVTSDSNQYRNNGTITCSARHKPFNEFGATFSLPHQIFLRCNDNSIQHCTWLDEHRNETKFKHQIWIHKKFHPNKFKLLGIMAEHHLIFFSYVSMWMR